MNPKSFPIASWLSLTLALPAAADVIYSNLQDIAIPADFAGVYLDVDTGNWNTDINSPQSGWDINPFFGGSVIWTSPTFQPVRSGTGNMDAVVKLAEGTTVGGGSTYSTFTWDHDNNIITPQVPGYGGSETHLGGGSGQFTAGQEGYIGFRLNDTNYGYMRVLFTNNTGGALIKEWAYDDDGVSIAVANVKRNGSTVALDSSQGSFTLSSPVVNSYGTTNLLKTGTGTTTLTGVNTYTGTTTVSGGALVISGSLANTATTVENTGTLRGDGVIAGSVTIELGGTLGAGDNGIQSLATGTLNLQAGSNFVYELNSDASSTAAGDLVAVTGDLILNSDSNALTLALLDLSGSGVSGWSAGEKLTLVSYSGNWDGGLFSYLSSAVADNSIISFGGINWLFNYNDTIAGTNFTGDLTAVNRVTMLAVPETSATLLGALGALALLRRRRK